MVAYQDFRISVQQGDEALTKLPAAKRRVGSVLAAKPTVAAESVISSIKATSGAETVIEQVMGLIHPTVWRATATFTVAGSQACDEAEAGFCRTSSASTVPPEDERPLSRGSCAVHNRVVAGFRGRNRGG